MLRVCVAAIAAGIALSACAAQQQHTVAAASAVVTKDDPFLPYREYQSGVTLDKGAPLAGNPARVNVLLARVDKKSAQKAFAVQVHLLYPENHKMKFEKAFGQNASPLMFKTVVTERDNCKKGRCYYTEVANVFIPEADLRAAGTGGYTFKLFARAGNTAVIGVPAPVIASVLAKVDADPAVAGMRAGTGAKLSQSR